MKRIRLILVIAAAVVLCGCGAEGNGEGLPSSAGKVPDIRGRILSEEKKASEKAESKEVHPAAKETGKEKQQTDQKQDDNDTKETAGGQSEPQSGTAEKQDTTIKGNNERQAATVSGQGGKIEEPEYRSAEVPKTKKGMEEREKTAPGNQQETKESEASSTHTHQWEQVTKTIRHPAETEQRWIVDRKAWKETITKEEPVYEDVLICVAACRGCGASFSSEDVDSALNQCHSHIISEHGNSCGYGTEQSYYEKRQTGTTSKKETIFHPEEGHYETVETKAAWTETVVTGYRCTSCGSTK